MVSYFVGDPSGEGAMIIADDLGGRIASERVQITTDGRNAYRTAWEEAFGADADYATIEMIYRTDPAATRGRYSPPICTGVHKKTVEGDPDPAHISTIYVERCNLFGGNPPVHAPDQRLPQELREPLSRAGALLHVLQLGAHP
jgi:hypothetical protein